MERIDRAVKGKMMEQEPKKSLVLPEAVQEKLKGKRIVLAGTEEFEQAGDQDCAILMVPAGTANMHRDAAALQRALAALAEKKPESAVLISRNAVYGKVFGRSSGLKEHELGYVCHTSAEDGAAFEARFAENLAFRFAAEEGLNLKIVRMDEETFREFAEKMPESGILERDGRLKMQKSCTGEPDTDGSMKMQKSCTGEPDTDGSIMDAKWQMVCSVIADVLLYGEAGGVYNLPEFSENTAEYRNSPLSPAHVGTDTTKVQALHGTGK